MFIEKFSYSDTNPASAWQFDEVDFRKSNLLVGKSGCGKTRFLATIFNLGLMIASEKEGLHSGHWNLLYQHRGSRFRYELRVVDNKVDLEKLESIDDNVELISRTRDSMIYKNSALPQLTLEQPAIALLKEDESMKKPYGAFKLICRRRFDSDGLSSVRAVSNVPQNLLKSFEVSGLDPMQIFGLPLSSRLFVIDKIDKPLFVKIRDMFLDIFPEFTAWQVRKLKADEVPAKLDGVMPGVFLTEKNVGGQIPLAELSSGMQKVLLIIVDIMSAPEGTIYLIDEYENSLGVNAIDFLPDLLALSTQVQTIITTHHPYLINAMPIEDWQIMSREGSSVSIVRGDSRKEIYGASAQEAFTQLLNDPVYSKS